MIRLVFILLLALSTPATASSYLRNDLPEKRFASAKNCARELDRLLAQPRAAGPGETLEAVRKGDTITLRTSLGTGIYEQSYSCRNRTLISNEVRIISIDRPPPSPSPPI